MAGDQSWNCGSTFTLLRAKRHAEIYLVLRHLAWADGYERRPAAHRRSREQRSCGSATRPAVTLGSAFVGIAGTYVLNAFRRRASWIRPSLDWLIKNVGPHACVPGFVHGRCRVLGDSLNGPENDPDDAVVGGLIDRDPKNYVSGVVEHYCLAQ